MLAPLAPECGLAGDHYHGSSGVRQVSLIGCENLAAIGSFLGIEAAPAQLRRNIVVSGINLLALKGCWFRLGAALLEYTGDCHPCSRMEDILGAGGYNAVRGQGGILARVLEAGPVALGDPIARVATAAARC